MPAPHDVWAERLIPTNARRIQSVRIMASLLFDFDDILGFPAAPPEQAGCMYVLK